jgi:hypothetical protein
MPEISSLASQRVKIIYSTHGGLVINNNDPDVKYVRDNGREVMVFDELRELVVFLLERSGNLEREIQDCESRLGIFSSQPNELKPRENYVHMCKGLMKAEALERENARAYAELAVILRPSAV